MHDIRLLRDDPASFDAGLARRGLPAQASDLVAIDAEHRAKLTHAQELLARRNAASKAIGAAKAARDEAQANSLMAEVAELKQTLPALEAEAERLGRDLHDRLAALPNLPASDVPEGEDESGNVELKRWGNPRAFDFTPQEHADFAPALGLEFETAAKLSGARFAFLWGHLARLERALGQYMLDMQVREAGYTECATPLLVRDDAAYGTAQLPKFEADLFSTKVDLEPILARLEGSFRETLNNSGVLSAQVAELALLGAMARAQEAASRPEVGRRWLISTAEMSLTNAVRERILEAGELPLRLTALTPCFRSEAGAAGRDTRGYIRQHQFWKVELVSIVAPEDSDAEHERMTRAAEAVLESLELPYRRMLLCAGDTGFSARKTYDLEVWLPGQGTYREISSCSNVGDFQARRMDARYRPADAKGTAFVHTLNGSGLAVGRTLVAVLENYQQADGSVTIPPPLRPYMGGVERLEPRS